MKQFVQSVLFRLFSFLALSFILLSPLSAQTGMRGITAMEAAAEMAPGLNLFNTLDCVGDWVSGLAMETMWGNPYTTFEMVEAMADRGFKTLRIPVSWGYHMGPAPDYAIDKAWMDRVEEVVNYALDNGMYAIVNIHHDDDWIIPTYEKQEEATDQLVKTWTQIATRFRDYSDYLIFETMNEPREAGSAHEWSDGTNENRDVINAFNLAAVNAIRATGGNNAQRFIMIPQYAAGFGAAKQSLVIPNDDPNIIVSLHNYSPWNFTLNNSGTARWGTPAEIKALQDEIKAYSDYFVKKGLPVVVGECGAGNKDNYGDRVMWYDTFANACRDHDVTPLLWIYEFNRRTLTWEYPLIEDAVLFAYDSTVVDVEDIVLNITSDTLYYGETLQLEATILPENATAQAVAWTTHNAKRATVSPTGLVTAVGSGNVKITATTIGKTTTCFIHVVDTTAHTQFVIEAEDFDNQSGIQTESTTDTNGGQNVGYIENGDWCSYGIRIDSAGVYDFTARVATNTNGGTIEIRAKNKVVGEVKVEGSKSNGWQDWYTTEPVEIILDKGSQNLKLTFKGGAGYLFNINWFELSYNRPFVETTVDDNRGHIDDYRLDQSYPNPFNNSTTITYHLPVAGNVELSVYNYLGQKIATLVNTQQTAGTHTVSWDASGFASGVYYYKMKAGDFVKTKKFTLQK